MWFFPWSFSLVTWQLSLSHCSGPKPWGHALCPISGEIPSSLPSQFIWESDCFSLPAPCPRLSHQHLSLGLAGLPAPTLTLLGLFLTLFISQPMAFLCISQLLTTLEAHMEHQKHSEPHPKPTSLSPSALFCSIPFIAI